MHIVHHDSDQLTYIFTFPDFKVDSGLRNSDRLWKTTSFSTWFLKDLKAIRISGLNALDPAQAFKVVYSRAQKVLLTIATCVSRASLMKWLRTLRSQIGLSGDSRPGLDNSNMINSRANSPASKVIQVKTPEPNIKTGWKQGRAQGSVLSPWMHHWKFTEVYSGFYVNAIILTSIWCSEPNLLLFIVFEWKWSPSRPRIYLFMILHGYRFFTQLIITNNRKSLHCVLLLSLFCVMLD